MPVPAALAAFVSANWRKAVPVVIVLVACFGLWLLASSIRDAWRADMAAAEEKGRTEIRTENLRLRAEAAEARGAALQAQLDAALERTRLAEIEVAGIRAQRDKEVAALARHDLRKLLNAKPKLIESRANAATQATLDDFATVFED